MLDLTTIVWMAAIGFAAASFALVVVSAWPVARGAGGENLTDGGIVYLFEGRRLIDATARARRLLPKRVPDGDDWTRFVLTFAPRFNELEDQLSDLQHKGLIRIEESSGARSGMVLTAEWKDGLVRLSLDENEDSGELPETVERYALSAMQSELTTLRSVAELAPTLIWRQRPDGTVIWANSAYMSKAIESTSSGALLTWPPPTLFPDLIDGDIQPSANDVRRVSLVGSGDANWFDLITTQEGEDLLCFASPIDKLVKTEAALTNFVQTLTKTFAHLTVGLAVFDRKRQLALFNPALLDLSGLSSEFLSKKPTLRAFLDGLRDHQRVPEPKDYRSWRMKIAQLESEAADGTYEETWDLPTGQTYKVRGRPHPDGAVAFIFEDISKEVSLTRTFRSEIELSASVINSLEDAVGVFSPTGTLILTNPAFAALWDLDAESALSDISVHDAIERWKAACRPGGGIEALEEMLVMRPQRSAWLGRLMLENGARMTCRLHPITAGNLMISFRSDSRRPSEAAGKVTQGVFMDS